MLHENLLILTGLLVAVFLLVMLGEKLRISYPIFLVLSGLIISLIPGIPLIEISPDMIFLIFLPPLLYEAAWFTSWKDFWKWKRPILFLAFGLVFFTSLDFFQNLNFKLKIVNTCNQVKSESKTFSTISVPIT